MATIDFESTLWERAMKKPSYKVGDTIKCVSNCGYASCLTISKEYIAESIFTNGEGDRLVWFVKFVGDKQIRNHCIAPRFECSTLLTISEQEIRELQSMGNR